MLVLSRVNVEQRKSLRETSGERRFYVYAHFRGDNKALFYIGKGSGNRAWASHGRNRWWKNVASEAGFIVRVVAANLTEEEALELEARLTKPRRRRIACATDGGGGVSGYRHTAAAKEAMSKKRRGVKWSPERRRRHSEAIRSRPDLIEQRRKSFTGDDNPSKKEEVRKMSSERMKNSNPMRCPHTREKMRKSCKGRIISQESRDKISKALKGRKRGPMPDSVRLALDVYRESRKKKVKTDCGLRFDCMNEAAKTLGIRQGSISNNCLGRTKSAGGYVWSFDD